MDIRLLRTFIAAYEETSFTRAALRVHGTQPGVSAQIAVLEDTIGARLFERNARSVTPTVAAKRLYPRALQLIHDLKKAELEIRSLSGRVTGQVSMGIPPTLSKAILGPVLARYLSSYPEVEVRIFEAYSDSLLSLIESGELDVALVAHLADRPAINYQKVYRDRFVVVSGASCKLEPGRPIRLDVEPHFKIVIPSLLRHSLHTLLDEPLRTGRIMPARIIEIDGLSGALEFLSMTDWIALLPAATAYNNSQPSNIHFNPIAGDEIAINYFVAHARIEPISVATQAFIDLVIAELNLVAAQWLRHPDCSSSNTIRPQCRPLAL